MYNSLTIYSIVNGDINFSSKNNLASSRDINPHPAITLFKKDFLVGRSLSNEKRPITESAFFSTAAKSVKSTDFTFDLLKKLNKRQESIYLNTEYDTKHCSNQIEQKKKQIISLLNSGKYAQNRKYNQKEKRHIIDNQGKSKVMVSLISLQKRLESKNNYPK